MKCNYRVNRDLMLELEGSNQKELFEQMAAAAEIFGNWECCGKCKSPEHRPRPVVREVDDNRHYELRCTNPRCEARFTYGQNKKGGTLFPQRKFPKTEDFKPDGGWVIWKKGDDGNGRENQLTKKANELYRWPFTFTYLR